MGKNIGEIAFEVVIGPPPAKNDLTPSE